MLDHYCFVIIVLNHNLIIVKLINDDIIFLNWNLNILI